MARQDNVITASHYDTTVAMSHRTGVIIYPLLSQDALMDKHSW